MATDSIRTTKVQILALLLGGCGSTSGLSPLGTDAHTVFSQEKPSGCKMVSEFYGRGATEEHVQIMGSGLYLIPTLQSSQHQLGLLCFNRPLNLRNAPEQQQNK